MPLPDFVLCVDLAREMLSDGAYEFDVLLRDGTVIKNVAIDDARLVQSVATLRIPTGAGNNKVDNYYWVPLEEIIALAVVDLVVITQAPA